MDDFGRDIIGLIDEDGNELEFEMLSAIELNGNEYVALTQVYDDAQEFLESDGEVVILKVIEGENGEEDLVSIEDEEEFDAVWAEFEKILEEDYEIEQ